MRCTQAVDARWRHGAEWTVRVRYCQLNDDDDAVVPHVCKELSVSGEATSTVVDSLATDRQYLITVNARNDIGYNTSLIPEPVVISNAETSKCFLRAALHATYLSNFRFLSIYMSFIKGSFCGIRQQRARTILNDKNQIRTVCRRDRSSGSA